MVYLASLADGHLIASNVVKPISKFTQVNDGGLDVRITELLLLSAKIERYSNLHKAIEGLLSGETLIFLAAANEVLTVSFPGYPRRMIEEPKERVVRGPREGFIEDLTDNLSLVRRYIKDPNLRIDAKHIGERTKTKVAIVYLNDVVNPDIVGEVHKRLEQINIDGILDSSYIMELIADNKLTPFPLLQSTERPDKVASALLEGRVALIVDRSPFALIAPVTATELYQSPEDFYFNYWVGTFLRIIRAIGTLISIVLPGLYVSAVAINPEILPASVVLVLASGRTTVPFSVIVEMLVVLITFEVFREAILRVPKGVDIILGVAGGILLGWSATQAGVVSGATLAVMVITVLATFATADQEIEQAWRLVRYFLLLGGAALGVPGLVLTGTIVLAHLSGLKSFGVSYLAPWSPPLPVDMIDAYFRIPWWASFRRPPMYRPQQEDRLNSDQGDEE